MRHDDLLPYVIYDVLKRDDAEADGSYVEWATWEVDLPEWAIPPLQGIARDLGCDLETVIVAVTHKRAKEVLCGAVV